MVVSSRYVFEAEVWEHDGDGAWHFLNLPEADADAIEATAGVRAKGFGSIRVDVTIGTTRWQTSIFPDRKRATYVLPLKKAVRTAEKLDAGTTARVDLRIIE